jgi:hypothetical protein
MIDQVACREVSPYKYVRALTSDLTLFIETNKNA